MLIRRKFNKIQPKTKRELEKIIEERIKAEGPNCDLNDIDTSLITDMSGLFEKSIFNGDISDWNTSNVTNMASMFALSNFNGDISSWDTSNVESMASMFAYCPFNGDISGWNVSRVRDKRDMFYPYPLKKSYQPHFNDKTFACGGKKKKFSDFEDKVEAFNKSGEHDIADAIQEFCWDFWEDRLYHTHNGDGIPEPYTKQFQEWLDDANEEAIEADAKPMKLLKETDVDPYKCYVVQNYNCFKDNDWHLINEDQVEKYAICEIPEIEFARWAKACHIDL